MTVSRVMPRTYVELRRSVKDHRGLRQVKTREYLGVAFLALLGCAVTFYLIGAKSLWVDEINTYTSALHWQTMWSYLGQTAPSMGFYFNLMYFWMRFGSSEFWMRSLSAFAAIMTIPVVYILGRRLFGPRVGLMAAALMIVNVFFVSFAQAARGYSLAVLLTCLACYCFVRAVETTRPDRRYEIGYVVLGALAMYAHLYAGLVFFANSASLLLLMPTRRRPRREALIVAGGTGLAAVGILAAVPYLYKYTEVLSWIGPISVTTVSNFVITLAGGTEALVVMYASLLVVAAVGAFRVRRVAWGSAMLLLWLVAPGAISVAVSLVKKPIFVDRYLLICLPALALLAACGLEQLRPMRLALPLLAALAVVSASQVIAYYRLPVNYDDWRTPVSIIYRQLQPQDAVISFAREAPVRYYAAHLNGDRPPFSLTTIFESNLPYFPYYQGAKPSLNLPLLNSMSATHPRVWLVLGYNGDTPALAEANDVIVSNLERDYHVTNSWQFPRVALFLLQRTG